MGKETSYFLGDIDIEKLQIINKISFGKKNYRYFVGYLYNDNKVKSLHILLKASAFVKKL